MSAPYIPTKDDALDSWAANFATLISASPGTYGLVPADATAIATAQTNYHNAFLVGGSSGTPPRPNNPSTFTRVTVAAKNSAKIAGVALWRSYAAQIRLNPGVSNSDKLALGLNLPNNAPSPVPAPLTFPLLSINAAGPLTHQLRFADSSTPASRKKPAGALTMQLVGVALTTEPPPADAMPTLMMVTKQPVAIVWGSGDGGKTATYYARWVTRTGLVGPWSAVLGFTIPTGS